jgi:hypothetical protein
MDDIYVLLDNINSGLTSRALLRIEESVRGAIYSGLLSDLIAEALAKHSMGLVKNGFNNGHPDLLPRGKYVNDSIRSAPDGVEVKVTGKRGGAVDMHSDRPAWYAIFRYETDHVTQPVVNRAPTKFTDIWLGQLVAGDFRKNPRGARGTRTATPHAQGMQKMRAAWVYRDP